MILLLLALQTTTNCWTDTLGGVHCTTNNPPNLTMPAVPNYYRPPPPMPTPDYGAMIAAEHQKAVGKMLARGDCQGALSYALEKGDLDLAERVKEYCGGK